MGLVYDFVLYPCLQRSRADFPNAWPPHIYFALEALANVPANVSTESMPAAPGNNSWNLLPDNQLGITQDQLPLQTNSRNNTVPVGTDISAGNGTVYNGGNATTNEGWAKALQREVANRYVTSVFCSWYATGGSIPGLLPRLPNSTLEITHSTDQDGYLFEKFSALDVDNSGQGGEYTVQAGFGWTNGVLLWVVSEYMDVLNRPACPNITEQGNGTSTSATTGSGVAVSEVGGMSMLATATLVLIGLML